MGRDPIFCVWRHAARPLHYDSRLEINGTLRPWGCPQGPLDEFRPPPAGGEVEDQPLEYADFEGIIRIGNYGAGSVEIWDKGEFTPVGDQAADKQLESGKLVFTQRGKKLRGPFALARMKPEKKASPSSFYNMKMTMPCPAEKSPRPRQNENRHLCLN